MGYKLSRAAEADLLDIYRTGCESFGVDQAERYFAGLEQAFAFLAEYPRAARERIEITPPVRVLPHKSHLIIYLLEDTDVLVLRIRHGREDWESDHNQR
jgi:toxin ParE1/3/4